MTSVVVLTGRSLRHDFFRVGLALDDSIEVRATFCESARPSPPGDDDEPARRHFAARSRRERDFLGPLVELAPDQSNPIEIAYRDLETDPRWRDMILDLDPDVVVCYGTSVIREPLLGDFAGRFLNVHLGLSPYYRGSGTNFWPFVNGQPEMVGVTFMHIDAGIDTGDVVHQMRAEMFPDDDVHAVGTRLIAHMTDVTRRIVRLLPDLERRPQHALGAPGSTERVYRVADFDGSAVLAVEQQLRAGMIPEYLRDRADRDAAVPVFDQSAAWS